MGMWTMTKKSAADRHKSGNVIRLDVETRRLLEALKAKNRRPFTVEVAIAVEERAKREGVK
jgi:hypothetical protein